MLDALQDGNFIAIVTHFLLFHSSFFSKVCAQSCLAKTQSWMNLHFSGAFYCQFQELGPLKSPCNDVANEFECFKQ